MSSFRKRIAVLAYLAVAASAVACSDSNPAQPTSGSGLTASITAPTDVTPGNGVLVPYSNQPVTLVVQNAAVTHTAAGAVTYTFEVATDAGFTNKIQAKDVAEASAGRTSVALDALSGGRDYYWHVRAKGGGSTGPFGATARFTVGAQVFLFAPTPISPVNGVTTVGSSILTISNAAKQGPAGPISYRFEVADNSGFNPIAFIGVVPETANQTSYTLPQEPGGNRTYYWRATAIDQANGVSSAPSSVQTFTHSTSRQSDLAAQLGIALWPAAQPPGDTGRSTLGSNWEVQTRVSFTGVTFVSPPVEALRIFDLMDRGFDPQSAIDWMASHGYPSTAVYYASVDAIGLDFVYIARVTGAWQLVVRLGA